MVEGAFFPVGSRGAARPLLTKRAHLKSGKNAVVSPLNFPLGAATIEVRKLSENAPLRKLSVFSGALSETSRKGTASVCYVPA